jgi:coenzyme PQQ precursor peptide PqqA
VVDDALADLIGWPCRQGASTCVVAGRQGTRRRPMAWTKPKLREICIGMEINGYFAGEL